MDKFRKMTDGLFDKGLEQRAKMFGAERTTQALEAAGDFAGQFQAFMTAFCFGGVWGGEALTPRERSLVTMSILAAQHRFAEFETHLRLGVRNGCTPEQIRDALMHVAVYCGVPTGGEAFRVGTKVLAEMLPAPTQSEPTKE